MKGFSDGFSIQIEVQSIEEPDTIKEMLRLAHRMCFTETALAENTPLQIQHFLNGETLDQENWG